LFSDVTGRSPKPIRMMVGLLISKHLRNVSDEQVVEQFKENAYYQYFCGMESFTTVAPCASSELVHFRHHYGEDGIELILQESIRVNLVLDDSRRKEKEERDGKDGRGRKPDEDKTAFIDSTVQEKNVTFPTDSKLLNKIVEFCRKTAREAKVHVRQTYAHEIRELKRIQRFRGRSHSAVKVRKADRRMRTIAGRLVRELLRLLPESSMARERIDICLRFVNGEKIDGHKIYSLHEPDVL
jgi:IS5 family transposase